MRSKLLALCIAPLVGSVHLEGGEFTFNTVDVPGALSTTLNGINNRSQLVGDFLRPLTGTNFGYLNDNGVFSTIIVPNSFSNGANAINDAGQIVGSYLDNTFHSHGFLDVDGVVRQLMYLTA